MRIITEKYPVYTFSEASAELKDKIRDNIHLNWDLYEFNMRERIESLEGLATYLGGQLDYSISCVPDRGEYIEIKENKYDESLKPMLKELINEREPCPFTGVCYDDDLIYNIKKHGASYESLQNALNLYLDSIHSEYESMLQDDYINDLCEANDYEFNEQGVLV